MYEKVPNVFISSYDSNKKVSSITDAQLHGVCVAWSISPAHYYIYFDGTKEYYGTHTVSSLIQGKAKFLLGQNLNPDGSIDSASSFVGNITHLNIWTNMLNESTMAKYSLPNCGTERGDLVSWPQFKPWMTGVEVNEPTECQP